MHHRPLDVVKIGVVLKGALQQKIVKWRYKLTKRCKISAGLFFEKYKELVIGYRQDEIFYGSFTDGRKFHIFSTVKLNFTKLTNNILSTAKPIKFRHNYGLYLKQACFFAEAGDVGAVVVGEHVVAHDGVSNCRTKKWKHVRI